MPFKDPRLQDKPKATDQFGNRVLAENLELLNHIGRNIQGNEIRIVDAGRPKIAVTSQSSVFSLNDDTYTKVVALKINPPEDVVHATKEERTAFARRIFDAIVVGGMLGIVYDSGSDSRLPKSPNEVLTPDKEGVYRADCDEIAFTFLAMAKKAGLDIKSFQFIELTLEVAPSDGKKKEEKHGAVVQLGSSTFVFEFTDAQNGFGQIQDASLESLRQFYIGRPFAGTKVVVTDVKSFTPRTTEAEIEATFHAERAITFSNQGKILSAIDEYETVLKLDRGYEDVVNKLVELFFAAAKDYAKTKQEKEGYYLRAVEVAPESYRANFQLGFMHMDSNNYAKAVPYFEKAAELNRFDKDVLYNLLFCYSKELDLTVQIRQADRRIGYASRLLILEEKTAEVYLSLISSYSTKGIVAFEAKDYSSAAQFFQHASTYCDEGIKKVKENSPHYNEFKKLQKKIMEYGAKIH